MSAGQSVFTGWMEIAPRAVHDEARQDVEETLEALVAQYATTLYRVAFSILRNASDADVGAALETLAPLPDLLTSTGSNSPAD